MQRPGEPAVPAADDPADAPAGLGPPAPRAHPPAPVDGSAPYPAGPGGYADPDGASGRYAPAGDGGTAPVGYPAAYPGRYGAYPSGPYGQLPQPPAPRPRLWPPAGREWRTAAAVIAALAAVGAVLAVVWVQVAPRLQFRVDQPGRALPVVPEAEEYIAADGRFVLLTLAAGVLAGFGCWLLRRSRGPLVLAALAVGGLLGAVLTWRLGLRLGTGYRPADLQVVGAVVEQPLSLRAKAALVVEPVAAVVAYLLAVGFSSRNDLGRADEAGPAQVSSGSG